MDVLVSACDDPYYYPGSSPSGRYTFFRPHRSIDQDYLYDRKMDSFTPSKLGGWLTDEILLGFKNVGGVHEYFIADLTGKELVQLNLVPMLENFSFDSSTLAALRQAEKVYALQSMVVVVLAHDFQHHPEANFILEWQWDPRPNSYKKIFKALDENGIKFETMSSGPDPLLPTPTVYLIGGQPPSPGIWRVPQPILRLRVPLEELDSSVRPRVKARRAQEVTDKRNANVVLAIGILALVGLLGLTAFGAFRSLSGQQPRT